MIIKRNIKTIGIRTKQYFKYKTKKNVSFYLSKNFQFYANLNQNLYLNSNYLYEINEKFIDKQLKEYNLFKFLNNFTICDDFLLEKYKEAFNLDFDNLRFTIIFPYTFSLKYNNKSYNDNNIYLGLVFVIPRFMLSPIEISSAKFNSKKLFAVKKNSKLRKLTNKDIFKLHNFMYHRFESQGIFFRRKKNV